MKDAIDQKTLERQERPETPTFHLPDIEEVSAKVHEAWMNGKKVKGITTRKSESGEELMVPYSELSESAKDLDRGSVQAVYIAINELKGA